MTPFTLAGSLALLAMLLATPALGQDADCPFEVTVRDPSRYDDRPITLQPGAKPVAVGDGVLLRIRRTGTGGNWPYYYALAENQDRTFIDLMATGGCPVDQAWSGQIPCSPDQNALFLATEGGSQTVHLIRSRAPINPMDLFRGGQKIQSLHTVSSRSLGEHLDTPGVLRAAQGESRPSETLAALTRGGSEYGREEIPPPEVLYPLPPPAKTGKPPQIQQPPPIAVARCAYHLEVRPTPASPLAIDFEILSGPAGGPYLRKDNGDTIRSNDSFKINLNPVQKSWVYLFMMDSGGKVDWLFPKAEWGLANPVTGRKELPNAREVMHFDERTGTERFYLVLAREQDRELEKFVNQLVEMPENGSGRSLQAMEDFMGTRGLAGKRVDVAASAPAQRKRQTFSTVEQRIEGLCPGCLHVMELRHE